MDQVQLLSSCHRRVSSCSGLTLTCPRWTMADSALRILKMLVHCPHGHTKEKPTNGIGSTVTSGVSHKRRTVCGKLADHSSWFSCSWISSSVKSFSMNSLIFRNIVKLYILHHLKSTNPKERTLLYIFLLLQIHSNSNIHFQTNIFKQKYQ